LCRRHAVILAQARRNSTAGKLNVAFSLGGYAVAGCGAIPPGANGAQNVAVADSPGALQNKRAVHAAVSADNECDLDVISIDGGAK
jgi:hypothetical protein